MEAKVASTDELRVMIDFALKHDLNRTPTDNLIKSLDESGLHVVVPVLLHEHAGGAPSILHMRCNVLAKLQGRDEPAHFFLDTDLGLLENLRSADALATTLKIEKDLASIADGDT